jgi:hypothetical protein
MLDTGEYPYFVETVSKLLLRKGRDADLFHGVLAPIFLSFDAIDY